MTTRRVPFEQLELLIGQMEDDRELARGYVNSTAGRHKSHGKWKSIATTLNAVDGGVTKDFKGWMAYWNNFKNKSKSRARLARLSMSGTGGGPPTKELGDLDRRVLTLLGPGAGAPLPNVRVDPFLDDLPPETVNPSLLEVPPQSPDANNANADEVLIDTSNWNDMFREPSASLSESILANVATALTIPEPETAVSFGVLSPDATLCDTPPAPPPRPTPAGRVRRRRRCIPLPTALDAARNAVTEIERGRLRSEQQAAQNGAITAAALQQMASAMAEQAAASRAHVSAMEAIAAAQVEQVAALRAVADAVKQFLMAYLALKLDLIELEHEVANQNRRQELRALRRRCDVGQMSDHEFVATYRLTKGLTQGLIQELESFIPFSNGDLNLERKVLMSLNFFAVGGDQRSVGQAASHSFSQPSVSRAINQVVNALNQPFFLKKYIVFPKTREDRDRIKARFLEEFQIPGVIGAIDGTHIAIHRPEHGEENFFNRKHFHSLNVQMICDADLLITSVDASHGGCTHDSVIWTSHPLKQHLQTLQEAGENLWLLGDSGYAQRTTMMTPILNASAGSAEAHYTELHVRARNSVERCFGVLKARWRCLSSAKKLHYDPEMAAKIINACVVLHNIAHGANLEVPEVDPEDELEERRIATALDSLQPNPDTVANSSTNRRQTRDDLMRGRAARAALAQSLMD